MVTYKTNSKGYGSSRRYSKDRNRDLVQESEENRLYWDSRHIVNWIGLRGDDTSEEGKQVNAAIDASFQEINLIEAVILRQVQALLARDPVFYVTDQPEFDVSFFDELWRQTLGLYTETHFDPIKQCLVNSMLDEYAYLRVCVAENLKGDQVVIIHCPVNDSIEVKYRSQIGEPKLIYYTYEEEESEEYPEGRTITEVQKVENNVTIIERHLDDAEGEIIEELRLNLDSQLTIIEMTRPAFVTPTMRSLQDALSHAATMVPRGIDVSHYSRIIFNAMPPGEYKPTSSGEEKYHIDTAKMAVQPGSYNYIPGIPLEHEQSDKISGFTTPTFVQEQPIEIDNFLKTIQFTAEQIYLAARMGHLLSSAEEISGRSRQILRDDHVLSLQEDAKRLEESISHAFSIAWMIETNNATRLALQSKLRPDAGKATSEEQREIRDNYKEGLISRKTAIALLGYVDSADAEVERIIEEQEENEKIAQAKGQPTGLEELELQREQVQNRTNNNNGFGNNA